MIHSFLQVALGGAIGSMARHGVNIAAMRLMPGWPVGTLAVNICGCLLMGVFAGGLAHRGYQQFAPFLMTGLLGGFTTFSAFSLDALRLWERGQTGHALAYTLASVVLSLVAVVAGLKIVRGILA